MRKQTYMGIDQYGQTFHDLGPYPRKMLLERLGRKRAQKMYRDKPGERPVHVGYVIGPHWITLYEVKRMERPA